MIMSLRRPEAALVHHPQVARVQSAVSVDGRARGFLIAKVALSFAFFFPFLLPTHRGDTVSSSKES